MSRPKMVLGFDYGTTNIGVAICQTALGEARPLPPLKARDGIPNWDDIGALLKEWQPELAIVGLPLNMDGSESDMCIRAQKFARRLNGRFNLTTEMVDERLSSFEAKGDVMQRGGSRDYKNNPIDSIAAKYIIESWLTQQP
ncbi:MAG TPA: Holliday junction resolvase RuvX [Pseudomonadales bacterium]|nr:Holliday junction resolvase RuvX [Pseudomonadales bacterium]